MTFRQQITLASLVALGLCGLLVGCAGPRPADTGDVLLGTLEFRDHEVHVFAGQRYTVEAQGQILAARITREELQSRFPEIHRDIETLYAQGWAGLDGPDD